jgi:uncharacterized protein (DUF1015 family)
MADVRAFRGYRYDLGRVGTLGDVIAPPYDVINPAFQSALHARSPYNVIRVDLSQESPGDTETDNKYTRAGRTLRDWLREDILRQDTARSLYAYHQDFEAEGRRYTRKGFLARVRLEPFDKGQIYAHEETMAGPKADRLKLMHATHMNLSPIFGMFPDPKGEVQAKLDAAVGTALPLQATDHLGVVSKLWPVTEQSVVSAVTGLMGPKPVFIADGHHRYETSLRYLEERRQQGEVRDADAPANFTLMMLVSMTDPGLIIMPTHRLVSGVPGLTVDKLSAILSPHFQVEMTGQGDAGARAAWEAIQLDGTQAMLGFGTVADGAWITARFQSPERMAALAPKHTPAWRELAVAVLHELVLNDLLAKGLHAQPTCKFVHLLREVEESVGKKECHLAALVPPVEMSHVEQISGNLERMPPKSTYFYPKLLTGLVFNPLTGS